MLIPIKLRPEPNLFIIKTHPAGILKMLNTQRTHKKFIKQSLLICNYE